MSALTLVLSNGTSLNVAPEPAANGHEEFVQKCDQTRFAALQQESHRIRYVEKPEKGGWTGGAIWESGQVLAELLSVEPERVRGKRVLELGTGCGLLGLVAGALGAREVTMTDQVLFMADHNLERNFAAKPEIYRRFRLQRLQWGDEGMIAATDPPYDVLLGSDIMYWRSSLEALADTIASLSRVGTTVLWATPDWPSEDARIKQFKHRLIEHGFEIRDISKRPLVAHILQSYLSNEDADYPCHDDYTVYNRRGRVHVIEMRRLLDSTCS